MPLVKIPINSPTYKNVDEIAVSDLSTDLIDGYINEIGNTVKRPGLRKHIDLRILSPIDGLYWWDEQNVVIVVSGGRTYKIINQTGIYEDITGDNLIIGVRPTFASDGTSVIIANGGSMIRYNNSGLANKIADEDAPKSTHIIFYDQYIIGNVPETGRFQFSAVGDASSWSALHFSTAESRPDEIVAIHESWREVILFGKKTVEAWYNDGTTPFRRLEGAYSERGVLAPYSIVNANNGWYFLDHERRVVFLEGRIPRILSTPFDRFIQALSVVEDAVGDVMNIDGRYLYLLNFPSTPYTLIYDYSLDRWYQWGRWDSEAGTHRNWGGRNYCYAKRWNQHLVGDKDTGIIYLMENTLYDDAGTQIRLLKRTGHIDHGTHHRKVSKRLTFKFKRGIGLSENEEAFVTIRWRDDGQAEWKNDRKISLGKEGEKKWYVVLYRNGIYRSRQYEIEFTDNAPFTLVDAEEEFEVLGS